MNFQTDKEKWENIHELLDASQYPPSTWIALGAGEYSEWGEANFLKKHDETVVLLYDERYFPDGPELQMVRHLFQERIDCPKGIVALHQTFV